MIHRIVLGLSFYLLLGVVSAQQQFVLAEYALMEPGDTLIYEGSAGKEIYADTFAYAENTFRNHLVTKKAIAQKGYRYEKWGESDVEIYQINTADKQAFVLEKPLKWLPASPVLRQVYRDSTRYNELKDNALQSTGVLILETTVEGFMSVQTPLRNFVDCLSISTKMTCRYPNGKRVITEWKDYYAKKIGLAQSIVRYHQVEANGKATPLQVTMLQLKKATIGGKPLEGKVRN